MSGNKTHKDWINFWEKNTEKVSFPNNVYILINVIDEMTSNMSMAKKAAFLKEIDGLLSSLLTTVLKKEKKENKENKLEP